MNFIPNIPPKLFTISAVGVGFILLDDTTANEQNALGNWLMLVAQTLCTNAFYMQVQNERNSNNPTNNNVRESTLNKSDTILMMEKMINALNKEIDELKKEV